MTYYLGIDLGTTYTAAATFRDERVAITELGNRAATTPSVIFLREDDTILAGDAANRRALTEPHRMAREFKRRIGDPTPLLVGGTPYSAESLSAKLLRWVVTQVATIQGASPAKIAVTYPANWGPFKLDLLQQALRLADIGDALTLTEPEAAAMHHATLEPVKDGMTVAVFDLGGGTFDAVVLRKTTDSFELLGEPEGIERLGGIDFDEAIFGFVVRALGGVFEELDPTDVTTLAAINRLRTECVEAKEALSSDTEATIPVVLPNVQTEVRLTRAEFEQLIRPSLSDAVDALRRAVRSAELELADIDLALLVGGSSRIPLVGQMLGGELGLPIAVHAHPKHVVALGAARYAANSVATPVAAPTPVAEPSSAGAEPTSELLRPDRAGPTLVDTPAAGASYTPAPDHPPVSAPVVDVTDEADPTTELADAARDEPKPLALATAVNEPKMNRTRALGLSALVILAAVVVAIVVGTSGGDGSEQAGFVDVAATPTVASTTTPTTVFEPTPPSQLAEVAAPAATPSPIPTAAPTPTEAPVPTPTVAPFVCPAGFCAHIEEVQVADGELIIEWSAHGYTPAIANFHAHFYFDTFDAIEVGTNYVQLGATRQGSWQVTDRQPFSTAGSAVSMASIPAGASQICVVPADSGHGVTSPENAECVALPASVLGR